MSHRMKELEEDLKARLAALDTRIEEDAKNRESAAAAAALDKKKDGKKDKLGSKKAEESRRSAFGQCLTCFQELNEMQSELKNAEAISVPSILGPFAPTILKC